MLRGMGWGKQGKTGENGENGDRIGSNYRERVILDSPYWDWKTDPKTLPPGAYNQQLRDKIKKGVTRTEEEKNRGKRLRARWDEIMSNWQCLPAQ